MGAIPAQPALEGPPATTRESANNAGENWPTAVAAAPRRRDRDSSSDLAYTFRFLPQTAIVEFNDVGVNQLSSIGVQSLPTVRATFTQA
jgi:hypothetical protein